MVYSFLALRTIYTTDFQGSASDWEDLLESVQDCADEADFDTLEYELDCIEIDVYAIADNPRLAEILGSVGYDGIIHRDTIEAGEEFLPKVSGKSVEEIEGIDEDDDYAFDSYRPFKQRQVKSLWNQGSFDRANPNVSM